MLLRNDSTPGNLQFTDVSIASGLECSGFGWGTTFMDGAANGWLDIAATNGFFGAKGESADQSVYLIHDGGDPAAYSIGTFDVGFGDLYWGSSLIAFDYDRDGDLDLVQTCMDGPLRLLEIRPAEGATPQNYLVVKPRINGRNHFAIGTIVRVLAGGLWSMRLITAGTSYMGQEPAEAFFGLGSEVIADQVKIEWPDGHTTVLSDVDGNQVLLVEHTSVGAIPTISEWGMCVMGVILLLVGSRILAARASPAR